MAGGGQKWNQGPQREGESQGAREVAVEVGGEGELTAGWGLVCVPGKGEISLPSLSAAAEEESQSSLAIVSPRAGLVTVRKATWPG